MTAVFEDDLASVRRANAELQQRLDERTAERDEALAREAATAEVLQVINTSPGNLAPVFESILDKALRLCEAASGALATWDGEYFNRVATRGPWTDPADPTPRQYLEPRRKPAPGSFAERIRHGENIISTSDLTQSDAFNSSPGLQGAARFGIRAAGPIFPLDSRGRARVIGGFAGFLGNVPSGLILINSAAFVNGLTLGIGEFPPLPTAKSNVVRTRGSSVSA
jgi:hypothetical protein